MSGEDKVWQADCGCTHHTVPHWLWMDMMHREMNRELMAKGHHIGAAREEVIRLQTKQAVMKRHGIDQIPPEVMERAESEWNAHNEACNQRYRGKTRQMEDRLTEMAKEHDLAEGNRRQSLVEEMNRLTKAIAAREAV